MRCRPGRIHQAPRDGSEDLDLSEIRDQHAEGEGLRRCAAAMADEAARPRSTLDQSSELQLPQGARDRDPRRAKLQDEIRLARQAATRRDPARHDLAQQRLVHLAIFWRLEDGGRSQFGEDGMTTASTSQYRLMTVRTGEMPCLHHILVTQLDWVPLVPLRSLKSCYIQ